MMPAEYTRGSNMNAKEARSKAAEVQKKNTEQKTSEKKLAEQQAEERVTKLASQLAEKAQEEIETRANDGFVNGWIPWHARECSSTTEQLAVFKCFHRMMSDLGFQVSERSQSVDNGEGLWFPTEGIRIEW